jgi:hypothetical protein
LPQELGHVGGWKLSIVLTIILMMLNIGAKGVISFGKMIELKKNCDIDSKGHNK